MWRDSCVKNFCPNTTTFIRPSAEWFRNSFEMQFAEKRPYKWFSVPGCFTTTMRHVHPWVAKRNTPVTPHLPALLVTSGSLRLPSVPGGEYHPKGEKDSKTLWRYKWVQDGWLQALAKQVLPQMHWKAEDLMELQPAGSCSEWNDSGLLQIALILLK